MGKLREQMLADLQLRGATPRISSDRSKSKGKQASVRALRAISPQANDSSQSRAHAFFETSFCRSRVPVVL